MERKIHRKLLQIIRKQNVKYVKWGKQLQNNHGTEYNLSFSPYRIKCTLWLEKMKNHLESKILNLEQNGQWGKNLKESVWTQERRGRKKKKRNKENEKMKK